MATQTNDPPAVLEGDDEANATELYTELDEKESEEPDSVPVRMTDPFDPRAIDITMEVQNVRYLVDLLEDRHVDLNTEFQRSPDIWSATKMSRLIESLLIRLPIPPFYFAANGRLPADAERPLQVVDGLQRLSALDRFMVKKTLRLRGLAFLTDLENKRFQDLDRSIRRAVERAQVTLYLIRPGTPKHVTYILFERLNTGGLTLTAQEIRHALNQGVPARYLIELVDLPSFKKLVNFRDRRMRDRELALRYVAFRMTAPTDYRGGLKRFLDDSMEQLAERSPEERLQWKNEFDRALRAANDLFGERAFSKNTSGRPQLNKALFEAWTVNLAQVDQPQLQVLMSRKEGLSQMYRAALHADHSPLSMSVTADTSKPEAVRTRFEQVRALIHGSLQG